MHFERRPTWEPPLGTIRSAAANSFRILSPRLAFFTSLLTRAMLYIQYSRYMYNERIRLRTGQVQLENFPDDHVLKIQAQMTF